MFFVTNMVTGEVRAYSSQYNAEMAVGMDPAWVRGKLDVKPEPEPEPQPEPKPEPKRRGRPRKVKAEEKETAKPDADGGIDV